MEANLERQRVLVSELWLKDLKGRFELSICISSETDTAARAQWSSLKSHCNIPANNIDKVQAFIPYGCLIGYKKIPQKFRVPTYLGNDLALSLATIFYSLYIYFVRASDFVLIEFIIGNVFV